MNQEFAIEILEMIERGTCESRCSLAKEAYRYLERLKSTDDHLYNRIYRCRYKKQW